MSIFFCELNLRNLLYVISIYAPVTKRYPKQTFIIKSYSAHKKRAFRFSLKAHLFSVGGVGGIRTHARGKPSNDLANRPLQPA